MTRTVTSVEEAESIPDAAFRVGFNDYYETPDGTQVAVPDGTAVPEDWTLVAD